MFINKEKVYKLQKSIIFFCIYICIFCQIKIYSLGFALKSTAIQNPGGWSEHHGLGERT